MRRIIAILFLIIGASSLNADLTSSSWGSLGQAKKSEARGFDVPLKVNLKGNYSDGMLVLEGKTRLKNPRLDMYFRQQKLEDQSFSQTSVHQSNQSDDYTMSESDGNQFHTVNTGNGSASILKASFKLLRLKPVISTGKVTAEVFIGEDPFAPHLEAMEVKLNPFKQMPLEVVQSYLDEIELRSVKVVVTIHAPVDDEFSKNEFKAEFLGSLVVGESMYGMNNQMDSMEPMSADEEEGSLSF